MQCEIEQFIVSHYQELLSICKKYTKNKDWADELLHEVILQLYDKKEINIQLDSNSIKYYIVSIIKLNWCSKQSPFYRKNKKFGNTTDELTDYPETEPYDYQDDIIIQLIEQEYSELDWFDKLQFQTYLLTGTLRETAELTNSTTSKVWHNLNSTKEQIKNNILNKIK